MKVIKSQDYLDSLKSVLLFISKDKKSAAINFNSELNKKIQTLKDFPYKFTKSKYFDQENIRDLIHKGYTVPYLIEEKQIIIIGITKYRSTLNPVLREEISSRIGNEEW